MMFERFGWDWIRLDVDVREIWIMIDEGFGLDWIRLWIGL